MDSHVARSIAHYSHLADRGRLDDLRDQGLTPLEQAALELLTRQPSESYELYALRIAWARGQAGAIARRVKLADLDDHLVHATSTEQSPPYGWARRHIAVAEERCAA